jgi:hypothetical protein
MEGTGFPECIDDKYRLLALDLAGDPRDEILEDEDGFEYLHIRTSERDFS